LVNLVLLLVIVVLVIVVVVSLDIVWVFALHRLFLDVR
jgi:hypothetical protein